MRVDEDGTIHLSERNLRALLNKLERNRREGYKVSACKLDGGSRAPGIRIHAEPDDEHYGDLPAGACQPEDDPGRTDSGPIEPLPVLGVMIRSDFPKGEARHRRAPPRT